MKQLYLSYPRQINGHIWKAYNVAMFVDIGTGDTLRVGDMTVRLQFKTGKKARLKIDAPHDLDVSIKKDPAEQLESK